MASLTSPVHVHTKFLQKRKRANRRLARPVRVQAALPDPDLVNYAQLQLVTWILPMTIAGRLLKGELPRYRNWYHCHDCGKISSRGKLIKIICTHTKMLTRLISIRPIVRVQAKKDDFVEP